MIKKKLNKVLSKFKKFKVQATLALDCTKRNNCKILYLYTKLTASNSDIDETFKSMRQNLLTKIQINTCKDWIILEVIIKLSIKIFEC